MCFFLLRKRFMILVFVKLNLILNEVVVFVIGCVFLGSWVVLMIMLLGRVFLLMVSVYVFFLGMYSCYLLLVLVLVFFLKLLFLIVMIMFLMGVLLKVMMLVKQKFVIFWLLLVFLVEVDDGGCSQRKVMVRSDVSRMMIYCFLF